MLVTQSRGHSSKKHRLLPPSAPSSTIRAGFHQPTGDRIPQTWPSSPRSEQEGFFHSTVVTQAFGETVPNFPPPLPAPCCHSGPGQSLGEGAWSCFFWLGRSGLLWRMLKKEDKECRIITGGHGKPARGIQRGSDGMAGRIFAAAFGQTKSTEGCQGTGAFS